MPAEEKLGEKWRISRCIRLDGGGASNGSARGV